MALGNYTLRVDPSNLQAQAGELQKSIASTKRLFDSVESCVNGLANYWEGDASDAYRNRYTALKPDIEEMFKRLSEHCTDLNSIASIYTGVESQNADIAVDLSDDVIV